MPDIPDPAYLLIGLLFSLAAMALFALYVLACAYRPRVARVVEAVMPAVGTLLCVAAIVSSVKGADGWMLAGLLIPFLYTVHHYLWIGVLRREAERADRSRRSAQPEEAAGALEGEPEVAPGFWLNRADSALKPMERPLSQELDAEWEVPGDGDGTPAAEPSRDGDDGEEPPAIGFSEAARRLGISPATARRWAERGLLEASEGKVAAASLGRLEPRLRRLREQGVPRSQWAKRLAEED